MSVERLELSTNGLKGRCSAIELHARCGVHSITPPITRQSSPRNRRSSPPKSTLAVKSRLKRRQRHLPLHPQNIHIAVLDLVFQIDGFFVIHHPRLLPGFPLRFHRDEIALVRQAGHLPGCLAAWHRRARPLLANPHPVENASPASCGQKRP